MQGSLRVGLNLIFLGERAGGAGRYATELPGALLEADPTTEIHVFVSAEEPHALREQPWAGSVRWTRVPVRMSGPPLHVPAEYALLPMLGAMRGLDIMHSPANTGPAICPGMTSVVSLLDLIWLHRPKEWEASPRVHATMRRRVMRAVKGVDRIFAISAAAAEDISRTLGVPMEGIEVTPLGTRPPACAGTPERQLREELDLGDARVLLCVAQKRPYKNLSLLIRALPELPGDVVLVLAGSVTAHDEQLRAEADSLGVSDRVRWLGWLSDQQLEGLYACSSVFALPSLIEGFGLPVIEAMLRGIPVACAEIPALCEVAGDAALTFDPQSVEQAAGAVGRLLEDRELAGRLVRLGKQRAETFSWRRTGELSLEGYRRAIASPNRGARDTQLSRRR